MMVGLSEMSIRTINMALRIFLMDSSYSCKEHYVIQMTTRLNLPNNWKTVCRRVCLNWEGENDSDVMLECLVKLFHVYKARNGFNTSYENDEEGIEKMLCMFHDKGISVITIVYENMILYGDLLRNTTSITTSESEFTDKMEAIKDEVMTMLDDGVDIGYLRPNREWLQKLDKKRLEQSCEMAYSKLLSILEGNKESV
jgi:hypothetical protein